MAKLITAKKGVISLTTIVVAAIALIVLIVLIAIFTGRINIFGKSYDQQTGNAQSSVCNTNGGQCMDSLSTNCASPKVLQKTPNLGSTWIDCSNTESCCIKPTTS